MREDDSGESVGLAVSAVEVRCLRRLSTEVAAQVRRSLPGRLCDLAGMVPGGRVELLFWTTERDVVVVRWSASAGVQMDALALIDAIGALLDQSSIVDAAESDCLPTDVAFWPVLPAVQSRQIGFAPETGMRRWVASLPEDGEPRCDVLLGVLAEHPGSGVRIRLAAEESVGGERSVRVELGGLTATTARPALRLRALLGRWAPGLELSETPAPASSWFVAPRDALPQIFPVPATTRGAEPGLDVGGPPPLPAPRVGTSVGVRLGRGWSSSGVVRDVVVGASERSRHLHCLGRTGTGKSSLLAAIAHAAGAAGEGMLVLDPHGQLVDRIVAELPGEAARRTWLIRASDTDHPVRVNPLAVDDPVRREIVIQDLCEMFSTVFDPQHSGIVGPRFQERLAMLLRTLVDVRGARASLLDVPRMSAERELQTFVRKAVTDERVRMWWNTDDLGRRSNEYGEVLTWFNSKFERLSGSLALRAALGTGANALDMQAAMAERRIILLDLSKGAIGEVAARTLGMMHLSATWSAALQRTDDTPFSVLVDEAHSFAGTSLPAMLAEGRKFGLSIALAHQFLGQLDQRLAEALTGNTATTVAFRTGNGDAHVVAAAMGGKVTPAMLTSLADFTAVCHRTSGPAPDQPHTMQVDHHERIRARTGIELADFVAHLENQTASDLAAPFADAKAMTLTDLAKEETQETRPSFLDDWLDKKGRGERGIGGLRPL